jgi:hypothetical protein
MGEMEEGWGSIGGEGVKKREGGSKGHQRRSHSEEEA